MKATTTRTTWIGMLVLASAAMAQADDRFAVEGTHATRGAFTSVLELDEKDGRLEVRETIRWADGSEGLLVGNATRDGASVVATVGNRSIIDGFAPDASVAPTTLRLTIEGEGLSLRATGPDGERTGTGRKAEAPRARELLDKTGRHLIALARKEIDKRSASGARLDEEVRLGSYVHVGAGLGVRAIPADAWSLDQRASARRLGGRAAWLVSDAQGAARVNFGHSIPLGEVTIGVGLEAGARLRHEVTDLSPIPDSLRDADELAGALKDVAVRTFDLPLSAGDAEALTPGARHVVEGEMTAAVSGSLSVGTEVTSFGDDVVRVGASAFGSGFWRVTGAMRVEVTRLEGQSVRMRVSRGTTDARGGSVEVMLGASLDEAAFRRKIEPITEYVTSAPVREALANAATSEAASLVRDAVRIRVAGSISTTTQDQLDLSYRFDLAQGGAREAYDRAVRGDLTRAADLAKTAGSGVLQEHRVLALEERTWRSAELNISVLLRAGLSRTIRVADLDVEDPRVGGDGKARYEVFSFARERHLKVAGGELRRRALGIDVVRRARSDGRLDRSVRWTLDVDDPTTTDADARTLTRALGGWGLNNESSLPRPESRPFRSRYGLTRTRLVVEIGEPGVAAMVAASETRLFEAYLAAYTTIEGEAPTWATAHGRQSLEFAGSGNEDSNAQRERQEMHRAQDFVRGMRELIDGADAPARADALKRVSKAAGYDPYAISALLSLAPRDAVRLSGTIHGERIAVSDRWDGPSFEPLPVIDPRQ